MRFIALFVSYLFVARAAEMGVLRKLAENNLAPRPGLPACVSVAVQSGDPAQGASVILLKATAGCQIPWHWHSSAEHIMMVSGAAKVEMHDGVKAVIGTGGYAMMPPKHIHQFTCTTACTAFVGSDGVFDRHYVDDKGNEIPPEVALPKKK